MENGLTHYYSTAESAYDEADEKVSQLKALTDLRRSFIDEGRRYAYEEAAEYLETIHGDIWGAGHFRSRIPSSPPEAKIDNRPKSCRNRKRDERLAYPKSGCEHCFNGGITGCPFEKE